MSATTRRTLPAALTAIVLTLAGVHAGARGGQADARTTTGTAPPSSSVTAQAAPNQRAPTGQAVAEAICQTCDPPDPDDPPPTQPPPPPRPSLATLMARYTAYDMNRDGRIEINWLRSLFPNPEPYRAMPNGMVIVLVDSNVVSDDPTIQTSRAEMSLWLGLLGSDIFADGLYPYFVEASVYAGTAHQDGRTLLATRRFLKEVRTHYPLAAVLLVGSFPDAAIVRSVLVKNNADDPIPLRSGAAPIDHKGHHLSLWSELITPRAEIVLGDLDGNWEQVYREAMFTVKNYNLLPLEETATYPANGQILETPHYREDVAQFQDVFHIQDHQATTWTDSGWLRLSIQSLDEPSPEVSPSDRLMPNRIARPELVVSRIDPKRVAVMPSAPPDIEGKRPLDSSGRPQVLRYNSAVSLLWMRDRNLERRLIADYIARSHRFRLGYDNGQPFRTSSIRSQDLRLLSPVSFNNLLRRANTNFGTSYAIDDATLLDYIVWLKAPAVLRGIVAHSDPVNSQFGSTLSAFGLELATGGLIGGGTKRVWRWVARQEGAQRVLEPSFEGLTVDANFHVHRTMWENKVLSTAGQAFYVHEGCEVMRPKHAENVPYNHTLYGQESVLGGMANGESLMFFANGLGLMARNKVFNDTPSGFYDAVRSTGRFGYGWQAYFVAEAAAAALNERTSDPTVVSPGSDRRWRSLQRKRSYFWNTIGDPTLKIRY